MKYAPCIAGGLLGALFLMASITFFLHVGGDKGMPPEGTPPWHFMMALGPTGYMAFVKVCELVGGLLVAIPKTRNWGLLVLGPVIINILAFHIFLTHGQSLKDPMGGGMTGMICVLALYLLIHARGKFAALLN